MRQALLILLLPALLLFSCNSIIHTPEALSYKYRQLRKESRNYVTVDGKTDTTYIRIWYPEFKEPALNHFISNILLSTDNPDQHFTALDSLASDFVRSYDESFASDISYRRTWFRDVELRVINQTPDFVSLQQNNSDYTGGAHGNYGVFFYNYDLINEKEIKLDDIVGIENIPALTSIAEGIFRSNEKLPPDVALADGYFFENGVFALNSNFEIRKDGLKFIYNPYEIKPYVAGITELLIPYDKIKHILKGNSVISAYIN